MNLEVGMYCYNKTNRKLGIGQIISFQSNNNVNIRYKNDIELVSIGNIVASFSPIDLIRVGDYVNGTLVASMNMAIKPTPIPQYWNEQKNEFEDIDEGKIETILTKECFENNCYKIGDCNE